jgi:hypothetical protein
MKTGYFLITQLCGLAGLDSDKANNNGGFPAEHLAIAHGCGESSSNLVTKNGTIFGFQKGRFSNERL